MFDRVEKLIGINNLEKFKKVKILIVGIGGVGGTTLETLVRSGFMNIDIIDFDKFEETNLNRQIIATANDLGETKVKVALKRYKNINKDINLNIIDEYLDEDNIQNLNDYDYIIDACDSIKTKIALIKHCIYKKIKFISCMGTGKRLDPSHVKITTLDKTKNDPLAKIMRRELRELKLKNIPVVASDELPINNDKTIASIMLVPSTAGLYLAYYVIKDLIKE